VCGNVWIIVIAVTVIRHPKERLAKCTLEPLRNRPDLVFYKARPGFKFDATGYILLGLGSPPLSSEDAGKPLILLDCTWRLLPQLEACLEGTPVGRSMPVEVCTAYPRVSKNFNDPQGGLASVEALYVAKRILGKDDPTLLDGYRWKDQFLAGLAAL